MSAHNVSFDFFKTEDGKIKYSILMNGEKLEGFFTRRALKAFGDDTLSLEERWKLFYEAETNAFALWAEKNGIPIKSELLSSKARVALEELGHTVLDIQNMTAENLADKIFNWYGFPGWGKTILDLCKSIQAASEGKVAGR